MASAGSELAEVGGDVACGLLRDAGLVGEPGPVGDRGVDLIEDGARVLGGDVGAVGEVEEMGAGGGEAFAGDGGGVFAARAGGVEEIVGGGEGPFAGVGHDEREVLGVVVAVVGGDVEGGLAEGAENVLVVARQGGGGAEEVGVVGGGD